MVAAARNQRQVAQALGAYDAAIAPGQAGVAFPGAALWVQSPSATAATYTSASNVTSNIVKV